ncbi:hypothetical protein SCUP515_07005 [Seiridium cupressi]
MTVFSIIRLLVALIIAAMPFALKVSAFPGNTCALKAPAQEALNVSTSALSLDHHPFGIAYYTNDIAFLVIRRAVAIFDMSHFTPVLKYQITVPPDVLAHLGLSDDDPDSDDYIFHGLGLSPDKKNIYAAGGRGALVLDTERAVAGRNDSIVGVLANNGIAGNYSAMVQFTPDNQFVFLAQEFGSASNGNIGNVEVWKVARFANGTVTGSYGGYINLGYATVGMAFSNDNSKLYVTSEAMGTTPNSTDILTGIISVLDVATLKFNPPAALLWAVPAGCHPVRIKLGGCGKRVWVTARESNQLLLFDADKLNSNDTANDALISSTQVGTSPVSLALVGDYVLTADSNRFGYTNTNAGLTVVNSSSVTSDHLVTFPQIRTGEFPREFGLSPDGKTLLVSEFDGYAIRAVDVRSLNQQNSYDLPRLRYQGPRRQ